MTPESYARFYNISPVLVPVLKHLSPLDYHFLNGKTTENGEVVIRTGWYSGVGAFSKRQSVADKIIFAATSAGFKAAKYFIGKTKSASNERVKIIIVPTALRKEYNNQ